MARGRKAGFVDQSLEQQIEKAQEKVIKTRQAYDNATNALQKLLNKRDAQRKEELWSANVGEAVEQLDIKAKFEDGVLKVFVPKKEVKLAVEEKKYITIEG